MVYRVLMAAQNLQEVQQWKQALQKYGDTFVLADTCTNGAQLLALAEKSNLDLLVVSSDLEEISGITAVQILRHRWGSGFRLVLVCDAGDFPAAQAGIQLKAEALLTRPSVTENLAEVLLKAAEQVPASPVERAGSDYKQIIGSLFRDRIHRMPAEQYMPEELVNSAYATAFQPGAYRVVIICIDIGSDQDLPEAFAQVDRMLAQLFQQMEGICWEALPLMSSALQRQWVLNYPPDQDEAVLKMLRNQAELLARQHSDPLRVAFCCSDCFSSMKGIRKKLNEASDVKWSRFLREEPFLLYSRETECASAIEALYQSLEKQLLRACTTLDLVLFQQGLERLFSLPDDVVGHSRTRALIRRVESYMFDTNRDLIASFANVEQTARQMENALQQVSSLEDYKCRYAQHMLTLFSQILDTVKVQNTKPVYLAKGYVRSHFAQHIGLEKVAEYVGLNRTYLSYLFKKETGIGLPDFINQCRIDEAKRLLETTDMKILSIASMVGFSDPRYFSRVFHAWEGCGPKDYRTARQRTNDAKEQH